MNIHFHLGGIAIMDVLFTILGILSHRVFAIRTTVDRWLCTNDS